MTNLRLREDEREEIGNGAVGSQGPNIQQRTDGVEGTGLDEHGGDGLAQSTDSTYPQSGASVPGMQDEPYNDHEGEEDVE